MATAIQSDLAAVGFEVEIRSYEWNTYLKKVNSGLRDAPAFLADVLAVLVVHRRQVVVEGPPRAGVAPVVLHVQPRQPVVAEGGVLGGGMEIDVCRRHPVGGGMFADRLHERAPGGLVHRQQARPGDRRVGHSAQPLREVVEPMPRIGVSPRMVEHEFAVRVGLQVTRRGSDELVAAPQGEVTRRPAPLGPQAAGGLQPREEGMCDEWIAAVVQRIPGRGRNRCQRIEDARGGVAGRHRTGRPTARTSWPLADAGRSPRLRRRAAGRPVASPRAPAIGTLLPRLPSAAIGVTPWQ